MTFTTIFDHANDAHRELKHWRSSSSTWQNTAKRYARTYGEAKVWKADDSVVRYWRDEDGRIRQRTYRHVLHTNH
jgi:hypothetical protein